MSVINSMLRDLDRRHAPLPVKTNVQIAPAQNRRVWPRSALVLCVLVIAAAWSWKNYIAEKTVVPANSQSGSSLATTRREAKNIPIGSLSTSMPTTVAASTEANPASVPETNHASESVVIKEQKKELKVEAITSGSTPEKIAETPSLNINKSQTSIALSEEKSASPIAVVEKEKVEKPAPIIKQERKNTDTLNDERYQLARTALAQNQPQRAYELLRDNPPPLANATDYHAVLAALEQQLGHYGDAILRYQQLLMLDQNQASWWLGLALSLEGDLRNNKALEGAQRGGDALAAYRHATALDSLPDAARQYANARIAALGK